MTAHAKKDSWDAWKAGVVAEHKRIRDRNRKRDSIKKVLAALVKEKCQCRRIVYPIKALFYRCCSCRARALRRKERLRGA